MTRTATSRLIPTPGVLMAPGALAAGALCLLTLAACKERKPEDTPDRLPRASVSRPAKTSPSADVAHEEPKQALRRISRDKLKAGFDEALAWAISVPDPADRETALETLFWDNTEQRHDILGSLRILGHLEAGPLRTTLASHLGGAWVESDAQAAITWAKSLQQPAEQQAVLAMIATMLADRSPFDAASLSAESLPPGEAQDRAVVAVVQRWRERDPDATRAWVETIAPGKLREAAERELAVPESPR